MVVPGKLRFGSAPSLAESRQTIRDLEGRLGYQRTKAVLGIPGTTLRSWFRQGRSRVSWPATRAIWCFWSLIFCPANLAPLERVMVWGKAWPGKAAPPHRPARVEQSTRLQKAPGT
jgi:hypothetical protein